MIYFLPRKGAPLVVSVSMYQVLSEALSNAIRVMFPPPRDGRMRVDIGDRRGVIVRLWHDSIRRVVVSAPQGKRPGGMRTVLYFYHRAIEMERAMSSASPATDAKSVPSEPVSPRALSAGPEPVATRR